MIAKWIRYFVTIGCIGVCVSARGSFPVIDGIEPLGVVRGTEATLTFRGQRMADAHRVIADQGGIEVVEVKPIDGKTVEVKIKTDANLSPGLYPVRLVTKTGVSNLRLIGVGAMPIAKEVEPNNDLETAQQIEINHTIEGVVDREDLDHYRIKLSAGQRLNIEIEGIRLHYTLRQQNILDPYVAILDERRFEITSSDDSSLLQQDGVCTFVAPADGTYTILVRDTAFGGSNACGYRLHVGTFPRPIATVPGGGMPGSILQTQLISLDGGVVDAAVQLPSEPSEAWPMITQDDGGISPSPNWLRVNDLPVVMETEPNDDYRKAPTFAAPAAFCGVVDKEGDYDNFGFECKKGQKYRVQCYARDLLRSPLDAVMNVFGPDHKTIVSSDDASGQLDPSLEFTVAADGLHTLRIYDHLRGGSPIHHYRIEVTPADPTFDLALKELRRDEAHVVTVPIGGNSATVIQAARKGFNDPINIELDGLPPGVTATTYPMPAGRAEIPVLFTASTDAKHDVSLFDVLGKGDGKNFAVMGQLTQMHKLVLGQNRRAMWTFKTDRAAIAVTDAAPFEIELVQPKTAIVRGGNKELVVNINRHEGFDDAVSIRTLYYPPGIGINNSRKIDKDKTTVEIPCTANDSAAMGQWPVILIASYPNANGTIEIATNAIMLDVQDKMFKYEFPKVAAEQGTDAVVSIATEVLRDLPGDAEVELVGLPNGVTSPAGIQPIAKGAESIVFPITVAKDAKVGNHKTLVCIARVKVGDETIVQTTGTGEIRIDKPLPPKTDAAPAAEQPKPAAKPAAPKPLSRLEQLRQAKQ